MPIEIDNSVAHNAAPVQVFDEKGQLTLAGKTVESFLNSVDWSDIFTDESVAEAISEDDAQDNDGNNYRVGVLTGDVAENIIDTADLGGMFDYYVSQIPTEGVQNNLTLSALAKADPDAFGESDDGGKKKHKTGAMKEHVRESLVAAVLREGTIGLAAAEDGASLGTTFTLSEMKEPHAQVLQRLRNEIAGDGNGQKTKGRGLGRTAGSHYAEGTRYRAELREGDELTRGLEEAKKKMNGPDASTSHQKAKGKNESKQAGPHAVPAGGSALREGARLASRASRLTEQSKK